MLMIQLVEGTDRKLRIICQLASAADNDIE